MTILIKTPHAFELITVDVATGFLIDEGALILHDEHHVRVAVYAPGRWTSATTCPPKRARDARGRFAKTSDG